jgi:hypothetical protein
MSSQVAVGANEDIEATANAVLNRLVIDLLRVGKCAVAVRLWLCL